jgi:hypothetical protein
MSFQCPSSTETRQDSLSRTPHPDFNPERSHQILTFNCLFALHAITTVFGAAWHLSHCPGISIFSSEGQPIRIAQNGYRDSVFGVFLGFLSDLPHTLSADQFFIQIALAAHPGPSQKPFVPSSGSDRIANGTKLKMAAQDTIQGCESTPLWTSDYLDARAYNLRSLEHRALLGSKRVVGRTNSGNACWQ